MKKIPLLRGIFEYFAVSRLEQAVVVFDDLSFVDVFGKLVAFWQTFEFADVLLGVDADVWRDGRFAVERFLDDFERAGFLQTDLVADFADVACDVDFLAVDGDVAVVDELTGASAGAGKADAIDDVV